MALKRFFPHELHIFVDKFAIGRRVDFITNEKPIDLLRFITSPALNPSNPIRVGEIRGLFSLMGDTQLLTTNLVAQLYGDPIRREKTPRILTSAQVKAIIDTELSGEAPHRRYAIAAILIFVMKNQKLIEERRSLAIDEIYNSPFVIQDFSAVEQDIVLVKMARALETVNVTSYKLRMSSVMTLAESLRELFAQYRSVLTATITRAPYLNTLYSMVKKEAEGTLEDIYLETAAYESAARILNFYTEPQKFAEIPFEYSTIKEYNSSLADYLGVSTLESNKRDYSRFAVINLVDFAAMFTIDRFIHSTVRELFSVIVRRNLNVADAHSGLVDYVNHNHIYIYSKPVENSLAQVEAAIIAEDASLVYKLLTNTHNLRMDLEPSNRLLTVDSAISELEMKLLALGLSDTVVINTANAAGAFDSLVTIELTVNPMINQDVYSEMLINPNTIHHDPADLTSGTLVVLSGDEAKISTNSVTYPLLYSQKNGGSKPFRTKTESVERFIDQALFINSRHTSTLANRVMTGITIRYINSVDVLTVVDINVPPSILLSSLYSLDGLAVLSNLRSQIVNAQDSVLFQSLMDVMNEPTLTDPTRAVLKRNIQTNVLDALRRINTIPWLKQFAAVLITNYNIPITKRRVMATQFNKLSTLASAYALIFRFIMNRDSLLFQLVADYLVVDESVLSNLDPRELVL